MQLSFSISIDLPPTPVRQPSSTRRRKRTTAETIVYQQQITIPKVHTKRFRIERCDLKWAQEVAVKHHYLHRKVHPLAHPFAYSIIETGSEMVAGMLMFATPHFTKCRELFGYPGLPTQWQCLILSRIFVAPEYQTQVILLPDGTRELHGPTIMDRRGRRHSLCVASCAIAQALKVVNRDWLQHHPPRFLDQPFNLERIISYSDPSVGHVGTPLKALSFRQFHRRTYGKQPEHRHSKQRDRKASRKFIFWYQVDRGTHIQL